MAHPRDQFCGDAECGVCGPIMETRRQARLDELRCADLRPRFERFERDLRALKKHSHPPVLISRWPGWVALAALALASWNAFSSFR